MRSTRRRSLPAAATTASPASGRTTPATTPASCSTRTATTSRPCITAPRNVQPSRCELLFRRKRSDPYSLAVERRAQRGADAVGPRRIAVHAKRIGFELDDLAVDARDLARLRDRQRLRDGLVDIGNERRRVVARHDARVLAVSAVDVGFPRD